MIVDELPRTAVGKLDRKALPTPEFTGTGVGFRAPGTSLERRIADAFIDVLRRRTGRRRRQFLRARRQLADRHSRGLAAQLRTEHRRRGARAVRGTDDGSARRTALQRCHCVGTVPLTPMERSGSVPLSLAQKRMWFLNQFDTRSAAYNIPLAVRLTGDLDVTAMQQAIADVVERHETLRTVSLPSAAIRFRKCSPSTRQYRRSVK